ncbi:MAG: serine hydrolase domain-containing protein [Pseudomonadota bacterium]
MNKHKLLLAGFLMGTFGVAQASDSLQSTVDQRIAGDRSGVCLVASTVAETIEHAGTCANPDRNRALDADSRFEIGSISKALQGLLVASLVESGEIDLNKPLRDVLPSSVAVPGDENDPIRLVHLLTHSSGLPRLPVGFVPSDISNPYADLDATQLLDLLDGAEVSAAPGTAFAYSNFGPMLLSYALVVETGEPLHTLFRSRVFEPLGMDDTSLGGAVIQGHDAAGQPVSHWDFAYNLGGVGAIRSTPADMARWLQAVIEPESTPMADALKRSQEELINAGGQRVGYGWLHIPLSDRFILVHDGGTGGFSSFAAIDLQQAKASLVLMDTSMLLQNSLADLAVHLIEPSSPLRSPQVPQVAAAGEVLSDYVGRFALFQGEEQFMGDFVIEFSEDRGELLLQATVNGQTQPQIPLASEGEGRFTINDLGLAVEFVRDDDGSVNGLDFQQGPLNLRGERL